MLLGRETRMYVNKDGVYPGDRSTCESAWVLVDISSRRGLG